MSVSACITCGSPASSFTAGGNYCRRHIPAGVTADAMAAVRTLMDYAYECGFHEMGYDPLAELLDARDAEIAALKAEVERLREALTEIVSESYAANVTIGELAKGALEWDGSESREPNP